MATGLSGNFEVTGTKNMTARFYWSETYDTIKNTHVVSIDKVQIKSSNYYGYTYYLGSSDRNGYIKVGSEQVVRFDNIMGSHNVRPGRNSYSNINAAGSYDPAPWESSAITGNANGSCSVKISFNFSGYEIDQEGANGFKISGEKTITLTVIDRVAPTVSCTTTIDSTTGMTIKGTSSVTCDVWEYSLDNGSTWTQYSTTAGASAEKKLTGLTSQVYSVKVRARKQSNQVKGTSSAASTDLVAPTVSFTVSNIAAHSVYIYATSNVNCNIWQYSTDNGKTWVQFSTSNGKSGTKTVTGLTPNTEYSLKVRARKTSNNLYGTSATVKAKTLGGTIINSVTAFDACAASPVITMNWTVYNATYKHTLRVKRGTNTILTITGLTASEGTINTTVTLTAAQRKTLLQAMTDVKSFTATFELTSFDGTTQIGDASTKNATIRTTASRCNPTFNGFSFLDNKKTTTDMTLDNSIMIQNQSDLLVTCVAGTPKNEATIAKYSVTIGGKTVESTTVTVRFGAVPISGRVQMTVATIDSRGYSASRTQYVTVIPYEDVRLDYWYIRRINEVEEITNLILEGKYSPVEIDETERNAVTAFEVRYRKSVESNNWSGWESVAMEATAGNFVFNSFEFGSFDPDYAYEIHITVSDLLTTSEIYLSLPKGTPLVAYRSKKVGINNAHPESALDVLGDIRQNGEGVLGFVGILDADFDTIFTGGIYWYAAASALDNAPSTNNGFLVVLAFGSNVIQIFVDGTSLKMRSYKSSNEEWSTWSEN